MKRVLLITLDYPPQKGGVGAYYHHLVKQLPEDRVHVLCHGSKNQTHADVTTAPFLWRFFWPHIFPALFRVFKTARKERANILWVGQVLPLGTIALCLHVLFGLPYFVSTHGMEVTMIDPKSRNGWFMKRIFAHAEFVTANSKFTANAVKAYGVSDDRIEIIYPCPNITPDGPKKNVATKKPGQTVILCVARFVRRKGQDQLIRAMSKIVEAHKQTELWLVGDGPDHDYLRTLAKKSPASTHIRFFGAVSDEELRSLYQQADVFAMPARTLQNRDAEGFGIVFLEANMFNLPVIGGNAGGIPDAIQEGESGFLVNGENIDAIAEKILYLIQNPDVRAQLGKSAKKRAETQFQWAVQAGHLMKRL